MSLGRALPVLLLLSACAERKEDPIDYKHPAPLAVGLRDPQEEVDAVVKKVERGELPKIQFDFDSDAIRMNSSPTLDAVVDILLANPKIKVMVLAHTCTMGTEVYNLDLSRRRARSVKEYLVKHGVPPPSIRYHGMGYSVPIADNSTKEGREKNRRVEFRVTFREWPSVW
ncbi:MAG: OmpA family protein [Elusimicrobia bacterium]|nr:OmpA family protein [Elusimicrobiota bacterium]